MIWARKTELVPSRVCKHRPFEAFQIFTVPSQEAEEMKMPLGEKSAACTQSLCPERVNTSWPVSEFKTWMSSLLEVRRILLPSGDHSTEFTISFSTLNFRQQLPLETCQMRTVPSGEAVSTLRPSGVTLATFTIC